MVKGQEDQSVRVVHAVRLAGVFQLLPNVIFPSAVPRGATER